MQTLVFTALLLAAAPSDGWRRELLPVDEPVRANFSASAAAASDSLLVLTVMAPLALQLGQSTEGDAGRRTLIYGETIAGTAVVTAAIKYLVARPRPYFYNADPRVRAFAEGEGGDARRSFFSGHAAATFAAAVAAGTLFTRSSDDHTARALVWGTGLALAGATANLRVRAGRHFYSDVLVGAIVGASAGLAIPALQGRGPTALDGKEWTAIAVAPLAGAALAQLVPFSSDIKVPLTQVVPWLGREQGGVALAGAF